MAKKISTILKSAAKKSAKKGVDYVLASTKSESGKAANSITAKTIKSDQPPAPTGKPVMTSIASSDEVKQSVSSAKKKSTTSFMKTTKGKWACAAAALVLAVGVGGAVSGTDVSTDATTHALVATAPDSSSTQAAEDASKQAAKEAAEKQVAEAEAKAKAEAEAKAKAEQEAAAKAAAEAEAKAKADAEAKAQAQQKAQQEQAQRESAAAAPAATPQASQDNAARSTGGGSSSAAPAPSSGGGGGGMAWIPKSGTKYHSNSGCSGMKNPQQVTLSEAQSRGYTACKKCYQ